MNWPDSSYSNLSPDEVSHLGLVLGAPGGRRARGLATRVHSINHSRFSVGIEGLYELFYEGVEELLLRRHREEAGVARQVGWPLCSSPSPSYHISTRFSASKLLSLCSLLDAGSIEVAYFARGSRDGHFLLGAAT